MSESIAITTASLPTSSACLATMGEKAERLLIAGDLGALSADERVSYYKAVCDSVGLNPLTQPFEYITLNGKLKLYAKRDATDQLRKIHGVSIRIISREVVEDCYVVTAQAMDRSGRTDESIGAVILGKLVGEARANALMKAETKSKRRVTLSICGLGMLDETEVETISGARFEPLQLPQFSAPPPRSVSPPLPPGQGDGRTSSPPAPAAVPESSRAAEATTHIDGSRLGGTPPKDATPGQVGKLLSFSDLFNELEAIEGIGDPKLLTPFAKKAEASHRGHAITDAQRESLIVTYRAVHAKLYGRAL